MSPLTVLSLTCSSRLACTVSGPETELPLKSPSSSWHSSSPLTVLASTSPMTSARVSEPLTVLTLTPARTPDTSASALTVLTVTSVRVGTERLTLALSRSCSLPKRLRFSQRLPSLSLTWLTLSVEPSQVTSNGLPSTECTSSRAVGESSWVTMSTRPATRPTLTEWTASPSPPMSRTLGPSICQCSVMDAPRESGDRVISRLVGSRYIALPTRARVNGAPAPGRPARGRRWRGRRCGRGRAGRGDAGRGRAGGRWVRTTGAARLPSRRAGPARRSGRSRPAPGGPRRRWRQVGLPLVVAQQRPEAVDERARCAARRRRPGRRRATSSRSLNVGVERWAGRRPRRSAMPAAAASSRMLARLSRLRAVVMPLDDVVGAHREHQPLLGAAASSAAAHSVPPAVQHVGGGVAAHPQVVRRELEVRGAGVRPTTRATQPRALGSPTPATKASPMKTRPTSRGPSAMESALGRTRSGVGLRVVVSSGHAGLSPRRRRGGPARWPAARPGSRTRGSGRRTSRSCSASQSRVTSSSPRRLASSSMPRSVKYTRRGYPSPASRVMRPPYGP